MKHKHKYKQKRINCSFSWACVGVPLFTLHKTLLFGIVLASPSCLHGKRPSCVGAGFNLTQHPCFRDLCLFYAVHSWKKQALYGILFFHFSRAIDIISYL